MGTPKKIIKQSWDESVKDTPEYDIRKAEKKVKKIKSELESLKSQYKAKFGYEYDSSKGKTHENN